MNLTEFMKLKALHKNFPVSFFNDENWLLKIYSFYYQSDNIRGKPFNLLPLRQRKSIVKRIWNNKNRVTSPTIYEIVIRDQLQEWEISPSSFIQTQLKLLLENYFKEHNEYTLEQLKIHLLDQIGKANRTFPLQEHEKEIFEKLANRMIEIIREQNLKKAA